MRFYRDFIPQVTEDLGHSSGTMSPRLPRSCPSTSTVRRYALSFLASVRVGDDFVTWCVRESGKTLLLLSTFHRFGVALQEGLWVASV
jgi:hypothetical protein